MKRAFFALVVMATVLVVCGGAAWAQQTDADKLKKGIDAYNAGRYQEAVETLQGVDASKLADFDKDKPQLYTTKAKEDLQKREASAAEITAAETALTDKKFVTALSHLEKARQTDYLSEAQSQRRESLTKVATDDELAARKETQDQLATAKKADQAGNKDTAVKLYTAVVNADVRLSATDKDFAQTRLATLSGLAAAPVVTTKTVAVETAPAEPKPIVTPTQVRPVKSVESAPVVAVDAKPVVVQTPVTPVNQVAPAPAVVAKPTVVVTPAAPAVVAQPAVVETPAAPMAKTITSPAAPDMAAIQAQAKAARVAAEMDKADQAMKASEYRAATLYYRNALSMDPDNASAKAGLDKATAMLGEAPKSLVAQVTSEIDIQNQRTVAKVKEAVATAKALQASAKNPSDYNDALEQVRLANRLINENRYLSPEMAEDLREEVKAEQASIEAQRQVSLQALEANRQVEITQRELERRTRDRENRTRQIASLWTASQQQAQVHDYKQAADTLDQLLAIDPQNERALRFRDEYLYLADLAYEINVKKTYDEEVKMTLTDVQASAIPFHGLVNYPSAKDWAALTQKRMKAVAASTGETEAVTRTNQKLVTKGLQNGEMWGINLTFTETSLGNVLDFIAEAARARPREINVVIDRKGITDAGVNLDEPMNLNVKDVSIQQALKMVLNPDTLSYVVQDDGTVLVSSKTKINADLPVREYFVQDLVTPIPDFGGSAPRFDLGAAMGGASGGAGGGGGGGGGGLFTDNNNAVETPEDGTKKLQELIEKSVKSSEPWESAGGRATMQFFAKTGLMIVAQTADGHKRLLELLDSLRRERAIMVNIESRFVTVTDAFLNDVTFDWSLRFVNQKTNVTWFTMNNTTTNGSGTDQMLPGLTALNTIGTGYFSPQSAVPFSNGTVIPPGGGTPVPAPNASGGGMSFQGSILGDYQIGYLLRAIQADLRSTVLFCPRLTLWNGQRAWIMDGIQEAYVASLTPVVAEGAVGFTVTVGVLETGTMLDVKATVSSDRRYVQLDLRPQIANLVSMLVVQEGATAGGAVGGGIGAGGTTLTAGSAIGNIQLPTVKITQMRSSVSVPDGGTLLVGGSKIYQQDDVESGVPILSDIPILKRLFNNRASDKGSETLLILVKPTIIIQSEKEAELGLEEFTN